MNFAEFLVSKKIQSEGAVRQALEIQGRGVRAVDPKFRTIPNILYLISSIDEDTAVDSLNEYNKNQNYISTARFKRVPEVHKILNLEEQRSLETVILHLDTAKRQILLGTISEQDSTLMRVRMIINKYLPNFTVEIKRILEIPYLEWIKYGHKLQFSNFTPLELEVSVEEKLKTVFREAIERGATDISIESSKDLTEVFLIIDKDRYHLRNVVFTPEESKEVTTWIITKSGIGQTSASQRIVDCALPELGDITTHRGRVNKLDSYWGVTINIRVLPNDPDFIDLKTLSYSKFVHDYIEFLAKPRKGLVLIVGPTNSGKNTTIFSVISELLRKYKVKTVSLEQPVEYLVPGVQQINAVNDKDYEDTARALVRQSPDIIYLSEIRDKPTMEAGLSISNTGKFVLSTMHVSHAYDVFNRAEDIYGTDISSKLTSELIGVINQMLLPKSCPDCQVEVKLSDVPAEYRKVLANHDYNGNIYENTGKTSEGKMCKRCLGEGTKGIVPVAEFINFDTGLKRQLRRCANASEKEELLQDVMIKSQNSILQDALRNMSTKKLNITTLIEKSILDGEFTKEGRV